MDSLGSLPNIGKEMTRKLGIIGISTPEELRSTGSKEAYFRLKVAFPEVCLVHLYTLQAAIDGIEMSELSADTRAELKAFSDSIR